MAEADRVPPRSALVLTALITGAVVANLNLSVANVALPTIADELGATQDQLTSIADAFALALAATVLYLGAIGDRYGRKLLFVLGGILTIPTSMLAAWSTSAEMLILARFLCGFSAALLFPTTLSLISALYSGKARVRAVALWSGLGAGVAALGPLIGGFLLEHFWWGSVFLISVPFDVVALLLGLWVLPWHAHEEATQVDHLGGVLSVLGVGALVLTVIHLDDGLTPLVITAAVVTTVTLVAFFWWETRASHPLLDLHLAKAKTFWVAFVAGAITFGSLIGAMFIGQQFTQDVLGYPPLRAAAVVLAASVMTALCGQIGGRVVLEHGSKWAFGLGLSSVAIAFALMLVTWREGAAMAWVIVAYAFVGAGVGLAATASSGALMSSLPVSRAGMGSASLDLTRDLGGALLQALMGMLLAGTYARYFTAAFASLPPQQASQLSDEAAQQITSSFAGAQGVAKTFSQANAQELMQAASTAFTHGKSVAIGAALLLTLVALGLVLWHFPRKADEEAYYARIAAESERQEAAAGARG